MQASDIEALKWCFYAGFLIPEWKSGMQASDIEALEWVGKSGMHYAGLSTPSPLEYPLLWPLQ